MEPDLTGHAGAGSSASRNGDALDELDWLKARVRRQVIEIDSLTVAVTAVTSSAKALKAENGALRAELARLRGRPRPALRVLDRSDAAELAEVSIPLGEHAPGIARGVIARSLGDHVAPSALDDAQLVVSELVTNSVCHSDQGANGHVVVRVRLWRSTCRIEVEDPGWDGVIEPLTPDPTQGTGMGLNLVQMLSESWGVVRAPRGPTRVWAQLSCGPTLA